MCRILYISIGQRYGALQVALNLMKNLLRYNDNNLCFLVDFNIEAIHSEPYQHIIVSRSRMEAFLRSLWLLFKYRPKIVHFNFPPVSFWIILLFLAKFLRCISVYSLHGGILLEVRGLLHRINHSIFRKIVQFIDIIIANSGFMKKVLDLYGIKGCIIVIPNGVNIEEFLKAQSIKLKGDPAILYVGRLEFIKGVDVLVKAIKIVRKSLPQVHLHIVGGGQLEPWIRDYVTRHDLKNNVTLWGYVPHGKLVSMFKGCDIFVIPSRAEGFGIVVLEAMAAGRPVIASRRGALPELISDGINGLLVEPMPEEIAKAIITLNQDKEVLYKIGIYNQLKASLLYDWKRIARKYYTLYKKLLNK